MSARGGRSPRAGGRLRSAPPVTLARQPSLLGAHHKIEDTRTPYNSGTIISEDDLARTFAFWDLRPAGDAQTEMFTRRFRLLFPTVEEDRRKRLAISREALRDLLFSEDVRALSFENNVDPVKTAFSIFDTDDSGHANMHHMKRMLEHVYGAELGTLSKADMRVLNGICRVRRTGGPRESEPAAARNDDGTQGGDHPHVDLTDFRYMLSHRVNITDLLFEPYTDWVNDK